MEYLNKNEVIRVNKAVVIEKVLDRVYKDRGRITNALLVEAAKDPHSELHSSFEWDDKIAGPKYRLAQANMMIMATKYVTFLKKGERKPISVTKTNQVRKFLPFKGEGFKERGEVLSDADARRAIVDKKKQALRSWCDGVQDISELDSLRKLILRAL